MLKDSCGLPARTALKQFFRQLWCSKAAAGGCQPAPLAGNSGAQKPLRAASRTLLLKDCCGLPARTAWKQLAHCLEAALVFKDSCGLPVRTALKQLWCCTSEAALVLKGRCGLPARTAPHQLEAALVLKGRCGLPARTAWKQFFRQLWCSKATAGCQPAPLELKKAAAGCQPAPLGSSFGAQRLLRA